jgi:hypothetical protein
MILGMSGSLCRRQGGDDYNYASVQLHWIDAEQDWRLMVHSSA